LSRTFFTRDCAPAPVQRDLGQRPAEVTLLRRRAELAEVGRVCIDRSIAIWSGA